MFGHPTRGTRLTKSNRIPGNIPLVTAGYENTGVAEWISNEDQKTFPSGLTIDMFGNCFYRKYDFKADDNILVFDDVNMSERTKIFVASQINKCLAGHYSYGKQFRLNSFKSTYVSLPVNQNGELNLFFMDSFIAELEAQRIAELEAYLKVTGLNNYELTERDQLCKVK